MNKIETILFDFGGVLLDLDSDRAYTSLSELLGIDFYRIKDSKAQYKFLLDYEQGKISREVFIWNIQRLAKGKTPQPLNIIKAWNAMLLGWDEHKFEVLRQLKNRYRIMILSNTNELHIDWVNRDLKKRNRYDDFQDLFEGNLYYSFQMGLIKPSIEIFKELISQSGIEPSKTLFIEDTEQNLIPAQSLGMQGLLHTRNDAIDYLLEI
ncbi:MAG TPA: HAD family phosphatase [Saprospiraceae bacterium]|nr:HAD family phosphatase [Saprospiraceae bacterium]MCB9328996.1 HAD family phosphatase [Lewinellaceae bacterium]HPQ20614.1 HAD family phosphatase [Saprospiraceae bacterium]